MAAAADVRLQPMTAARYADFVPRQLAEFAEQMVAAGEWPRDQALDLAAEKSQWLLDGSAWNAGHRFLDAVHKGERVGWVWYGPPPLALKRYRGAFLYQITIHEPFRGRGLGRALLAAVERHARRAGHGALLLNVFRWNEPARRLYEGAGYRTRAAFPTSLHLEKRLRE